MRQVVAGDQEENTGIASRTGGGLQIIDCKTAFEALLEAELAVLSGEGMTPLAEHVRECERWLAANANLW